MHLCYIIWIWWSDPRRQSIEPDKKWMEWRTGITNISALATQGIVFWLSWPCCTILCRSVDQWWSMMINACSISLEDRIWDPTSPSTKPESFNETFVSFVSFVSCPGATAVKVRGLKFCQILPQSFHTSQYWKVWKWKNPFENFWNIFFQVFLIFLSDGYNGLHIAETYPNHLQASIRHQISGENEVKTSRAHQRTPNHQALGPSCSCQNTWNILK